MDRSWLERELRSARSIESIAREVGRAPSTVSYWVAKHGLVSSHAAKHAPRGGIAREELEPLVAAGLSMRAMGERLGVSYGTIQHWLRQHGLKSRKAPEPPPPNVRAVERDCQVHGRTTFGRRTDGYFRCLACRAEAVVKRRRAVKRTLVEEAGGACQLCGYNRSVAALQFHHLDRAQKAFELSHGGVARALEAARAEAVKCVLLCANCHAEVEVGAASVR